MSQLFHRAQCAPYQKNISVWNSLYQPLWIEIRQVRKLITHFLGRGVTGLVDAHQVSR
jgi:hypothetical protein